MPCLLEKASRQPRWPQLHEDQAAAHAGADKETDDVFVPAPDTEMVFTQDAQVYVVSDIEGDAEFAPHGGGHIIVAPRKVRRKEHHAAVLVDDTGRAGGDGVHLVPVNAGLFDHFLHHADNDLFHVRGSVTAALGTFFQAVDNLVLLVEDGSEHFGSAHVKTDVVRFCHVSGPPGIYLTNRCSQPRRAFRLLGSSSGRGSAGGFFRDALRALKKR